MLRTPASDAVAPPLGGCGCVCAYSGNKMCEGLFVGAEVIGLTTSPVQTELLQPCVFSLPIFQLLERDARRWLVGEWRGEQEILQLTDTRAGNKCEAWGELSLRRCQ